MRLTKVRTVQTVRMYPYSYLGRQHDPWMIGSDLDARINLVLNQGCGDTLL